VRGPGLPSGERIDIPVGNTDIFPTVTRYLDLPVPDDLAGVPLQEVAAGNVEDDRLIFGDGNTRGTLRKFILEWPYKCILDFVTGETSLYNLAVDPGEMEDISESSRDVAQRLAGEILASTMPEQTAFHLWVTRSYIREPHRFTGTLRVPGGIERVDAYRLEDGDSYTVEGNTITFDISCTLGPLEPNKHLAIVPAHGADTLEATVRVDGEISPDRFFPHGFEIPEPSGSSTIRIHDFPLGPYFPSAWEEDPSACYIWGAAGQDGEETLAELDPQTVDQLRSLGYLN